MLTVSNISSAQAETYYSKDDYYMDEKSEWHGKGAEDLDLKGQIKSDDWLLAVNGFDRDMNKLNHNAGNSNNKNYRAGTDLTFSAPKSVSIASLNDKNVVSAHELAVSNVLDYIEANYAKTRIQKDGVSTDQNAGNLLIGKHLHLTSRELEPQLHTHSVIINSVLSEDGKRRSLKNDDILKNTKLLGLLYRNELANQLQHIGYKIEVTDRKEGFFQLEGIDEEITKRFSTRRKQVLEEMESVKEAFPKMKDRDVSQKAVLNSRVSKKSISREELVEATNSIMKNEFNIDLESLAKPQQSTNFDIQSTNLEDSVTRIVDDLHDSKSVFAKEELYKNVALQNFGAHGISSLESNFEENLESKSLLGYEHNGKQIFSSQKMKNIEHYALENIKFGIGRSDVIVNSDSLNFKIDSFEKENGFSLSEGQRDMALVVGTSKDQFLKIQGDAGTGKTTSLSIITKQFQEEGKSVTLLGPTARAAAELEASTNVEAKTVASFLLSDKEIQKGSLIVVDESGMLGVKDAKRLIDIATETESKLVFMGDTKQFQSISAGKFLSEMDKTGTATVVLDDSRRQKTAELQTLVDHVVHKDIDLAFNVLKETDKIEVSADPNALMNKAVDIYTKNRLQGIDTMLVTSRNEDREELNDRIRSSLKEKELLSEGASFETLKSKSLSATEKVVADNYQANDVLIAHSKTKSGIERGQKYRVENIDVHNNTLNLTSLESNESIQMDLKSDAKSFQVYTSSEKEFSKNDSIIFTKNDKLEVFDDSMHPERKKERVKVQNGQSAKIVGHFGTTIYAAVDDKIVSIETDLSKKGSYQHFDYNYAVTEHKSQGATVDHLISYSPTKNINSFNSFYVGVTRAKTDLTVLTDNPEVLASQVKKQQSKISTNDFTLEKSEPAATNKTDLDLQNVTSSLKNNLRVNHNQMDSFQKVPRQLIDSQLKHSFLNEKSPSKVILADTKDHATKLNLEVRDALKVNGKLNNSIQLKTLVEQQHPIVVSENTVLESLRYDKTLGVRKGDKLFFHSLNEKGYSFLNKSTNTLQTVTDDQLQKFKANTLVEKEIAKGDKIVFSSKNSFAGVKENEDGVVLRATQKELTVMTKNGIKKIDTNINSRKSMLNIDYGYAKEDIGLKYDKVITSVSDDHSRSIQNTKKALKHSKLAFETIYSDEDKLQQILNEGSELLDEEYVESALETQGLNTEVMPYEIDYVTDYSTQDYSSIEVMFTEYNNNKSQEIEINL